MLHDMIAWCGLVWCCTPLHFWGAVAWYAFALLMLLCLSIQTMTFMVQSHAPLPPLSFCYLLSVRYNFLLSHCHAAFSLMCSILVLLALCMLNDKNNY